MTYTIEQLEQMMRENGGNLDLQFSDVTSLPDNLTVRGWLDLRGTHMTSLPDNLTVGGSLYLSYTQITTLSDNLTVEGGLDLSGTLITSLPDNLTVSGSLWLNNTPITSLPDNLAVGGSLWLNNTQITSLPDNLTAGGSLYLRGTPISSLPDNLTVGGSLYLYGTPITSLPDNLTVGGSLYLSDTQITSLPDNLTVGGSLNLNGTPITSLPDNLKVGGDLHSLPNKIKNREHYKRLQNGDYAEGNYLFADRILTHVKHAKKIGEYTFYVGKIPGKNVVFDGEYYAHCKTFSDGVRDIEFKRASDRGAEQYRSLTLDSEVSKDEAITMYRVITGACQQGTESFVSGLETTKDRYTIREMISITQGQYGSRTFAEFFDRDN